MGNPGQNTEALLKDATGSLNMTCETSGRTAPIMTCEREELTKEQENAYELVFEKYEQYRSNIDTLKENGFGIVDLKTKSAEEITRQIGNHVVTELNNRTKPVVSKVSKQALPAATRQMVPLTAPHTVTLPTNAAQTVRIQVPQNLPRGSFIVLRPASNMNSPIQTILLPDPNQNPLQRPLFIRLPAMANHNLIQCQNPAGSLILQSNSPTVAPVAVPQEAKPENSLNSPSLKTAFTPQQRPIQHIATVRVSQPSTSTPAPSTSTTGHYKQNAFEVFIDEYYYSNVRLKGKVKSPELLMAPCAVNCHACKKDLDNVTVPRHILDNHLRTPVLRQETLSRKGQEECSHCLRPFPLSEISIHMLLHQKTALKNSCRICCRTFEDENSFIDHMKTYHFAGEMPFLCPSCNFRSSFHRDVLNHYATEHSRWYQMLCPYCLKSFTAPTVRKFSMLMTQHLEQHLAVALLNECPRCCLLFVSKDDLTQHMATCHNPAMQLNFNSSLEVLPYQVKPHERSVCSRMKESELLSNISFKPCGPFEMASIDLSDDSIDTEKINELGSAQDLGEKESSRSYVEMRKLNLTLYSSDNICATTHDGKTVTCKECTNFVSDDHYVDTQICSVCQFRTNCKLKMVQHITNGHKATFPSKNRRRPKNAIEYVYKCTCCPFVTDTGNAIAKHLAMAEHDSCTYCTREEDIPLTKIKKQS
ncbi:Pogo transposable element with ZNF domain [Halotydeus destructor]|nr:Pogo transposable element with ZNF domain [Halotydeus destructor]